MFADDSDSLELYTILAIDDDPQSLIILSKTLTAEYRVLLAKNSERGIELARSAKPDLIILDILMPGMNGFQVINDLKSNSSTANIPVIFLTSRNSIEDERLGLILGAVDYIAKPISPPLVLARVATQLAYQDKLLHQPYGLTGNAEARNMRDAFISALSLLSKNRKIINTEALVENFGILLDLHVSDSQLKDILRAAQLALIGIIQENSDIFQALRVSKLIIEEIFAHIDPTDQLLNYAWELTHVEVLFKENIDISLLNKFSIPVRLFALALIYHLTMMQADVSINKRHNRAMQKMLGHSIFTPDLVENQHNISTLLLNSSKFFLDK